MKKSIIKFTETNSSIIANHAQVCDLCKAQDLRESYALVSKGEDFDVFEFANGIWTLCSDCVEAYKK